MDTLESRLEALVDELDLMGDWTDRYRLLVTWGEELEPLPEEDRLPGDEVAGCSSPLWLSVRREGGVLRVRGASPGILPKALVAVVTRLFDGLEVVTGTTDGVLDRLGLRRHLSPTRSLVLERMVQRCLDDPGAQP